MIDVAEALKIADENFPRGPESVAEHLGIRVIESLMTGCDGWCVRCGRTAVVRLNKASPSSRRRFTLAHELAHLVLDVAPDICSFVAEPFGGARRTENAANHLAAELLLPESRLTSLIQSVPVDAATLKKVAKAARVSELMAACRLANLAQRIGLVNAAVVLFAEGSVRWTWSKTLAVPEPIARVLLERARESSPKPYRTAQDSGEVIVASVLEGPHSVALFLQLLPAELGNLKSEGERRRELEEWLFADDDPFRRQLNGCFGAFRKLMTGLKLGEAVDQFNERYMPRFTGAHAQKFRSARGQQYIEFRLREWSQP
jgi:Zn-dependent peptidase ImmA (M78 family)